MLPHFYWGKYVSRLPAVQPLSRILGLGSEGGTEFSRIVNLLFYFDSRVHGYEQNIFSDRSGDVWGLDSLNSRQEGFQYKFFSSPLSDNHRHEIIESLRKAVASADDSKIKKWILVTPDDLVNSAQRKVKGDVQWFAELKQQFQAPFDIEHIGHTKLQALFMQAEYMCLRYYPDLVNNGKNLRENFQTIRRQYDDNLRRRHNHIEFVGMSVRKDEASRGLAMERIYIPLATVVEGTPDDDETTLRTDPLSLLDYGSRTVILGDPGSGKSTVLRFLAIVGISQPLQQRYKAKAHNRLTIFVTLRRYADELKKNQNLPLIDYIIGSTKADFSIPGFNSEFVRFYLETGEAILLFDGVDELPDATFKLIIRERVQSLVTSFPGNTVIVTSRFAGYEAEARFEGNCAFAHVQMAPLRDPDIEMFARDWHAARTERSDQRLEMVSDLMAIISDPDNVPIRQLARNPLLLTIMVLVHRIDAVLPDQRIVLYQKCVETLMLSWLAQKEPNLRHQAGKNQLDKKYMRRLAAIANWMQVQMSSTGSESRAVVGRAALHTMLTQHILDIERPLGGNEAAETEADAFITYVREKAGLLIEAGTDLYSFIHLTFQEYLSAHNLNILSERGGDEDLWKKLKPIVTEPQWREVVRLLVAERRSEESQRALTERVLSYRRSATNANDEAALASLAAGLLVDRIDAAREHASEILSGLMVAAAKLEIAGTQSAQVLLAQLATLVSRDENQGEVWDLAFKSGCNELQHNSQLIRNLTIAALTTPLSQERLHNVMQKLHEISPYEADLADVLLWNGIPSTDVADIMHPVYEAAKGYIIESPNLNFAGAIIFSLVPREAPKQVAIALAICVRCGHGPLIDFLSNILFLNGGPRHNLRRKGRSDQFLIRLLGTNSRKSEASRDDWEYLRKRYPVDRDLQMESDRNTNHVRDTIQDTRLKKRKRSVQIDLGWNSVQEDRLFQDVIISAILNPLGLKSNPFWREALRRHMLQSARDRMQLLAPGTLERLSSEIGAQSKDDDIWLATVWLLLDLVSDLNDEKTSYKQLMDTLSEKSRATDNPVLLLLLSLKELFEVTQEDQRRTILQHIKNLTYISDDTLLNFIRDAGWDVLLTEATAGGGEVR